MLLAAAPVVAAVYDDDRLLALTAATAYLPLAFALQSPAWVFFRRMDYARQRLLQAVVPVVAFAVTVPLAAAGVGVWSLVIGPAAGNLAGIAAALAASPYRLALRYDRAVARRYLRFSVPVFVSLVAALVVAQGQILAFDLDRGLAWVGFVTLAATLSRYIDRADTDRHRDDLPGDLRHPRPHAGARGALRALQPRDAAVGAARRARAPSSSPATSSPSSWATSGGPARGLIQGLAVATAMGQLGFNWFSFYRAHERTRPPAVEAVVAAVAFCALAVPGLAVAGVTGFVVGPLRRGRRPARGARALRPRAAARRAGARPAGAPRACRRPPPRRRCSRCAARCGAQAGRRPRRSPSSRSSAPSSSRWRCASSAASSPSW